MASYDATRVTDTTRLDVIGLPVFAAIRPRAGKGSISVTSGKSLDKVAACVGALAEAFELSSAVYRRGESQLLHLDFDDFAERCGYSPWLLPIAVSNIGMVRGRTRPQGLTFVECEMLGAQSRALLPATLVYFPYHSDLGTDVYAGSTNGLASGNTFEEAVLHGLLEVIERDIVSFVALGAPTQRVTKIEDDDFRALHDAVVKAGCQLDALFLPNPFGIPTFAAYLYGDSGSATPVFSGYGSHIFSKIALIRACTEAVQSRLTHIHGARDDVIDYYHRWNRLDRPKKQAAVERLKAHNARGSQIAFTNIDDAGAPASIADAIQLVANCLQTNSIGDICIFRYPTKVPGMQAVRVIAPGLEFYTPERMRLGERLLAYVRSKA